MTNNNENKKRKRETLPRNVEECVGPTAKVSRKRGGIKHTKQSAIRHHYLTSGERSELSIRQSCVGWGGATLLRQKKQTSNMAVIYIEVLPM